MSRKIWAALVATIIAVIVAVVVAPGAASAGTEGEWWAEKAESTLSQFIANDTGQGSAFNYGMATGAAYKLYGWEDPRTLDLLAKLQSKKNPDGGYGLNRSYDAFQNGTTNPPETTYTVTIAGHVGPTLLEAYKQGLVPRADIQKLINLLVTAPKVPVARGQCVSYSRNANDTSGGCVHNVNAGIGWFLMEAQIQGAFNTTGMQRLMTDITIQELVAYKETQQWWPYINSGGNQDADHNSYSAESMYRLAYWVGRETVFKHMNNAFVDNSMAPMAHIRLAGMPGGPGSQGQQDPSTTLWCEMYADKWKAETEAWLAVTVSQDRLAQFSYYAARNTHC